MKYRKKTAINKDKSMPVLQRSAFIEFKNYEWKSNCNEKLINYIIFTFTNVSHLLHRIENSSSAADFAAEYF